MDITQPCREIVSFVFYKDVERMSVKETCMHVISEECEARNLASLKS